MKNFEAFILTGGASSRMKKDKAALKLGGRALPEIIAAEIERLAPARISLVGKNAANETGNFPVVADVFPTSERRAAIVGLHAALFHARANWILAVACDLPFVSAALFETLFSFCDEEFDAVVPVQPNEKFQPLCAFYKKSCLKKAEAILGGEDWSLRAFLEKLNVRFVEFAEIAHLPNAELFFTNLNTPEDFRAAEKLKDSISANPSFP